MTALKKKPEATECNDYRTVSLIARTPETEARVLGRRNDSKFEGVLGEDQFGFRRGKGTRNTTEMLRIILKRLWK